MFSNSGFYAWNLRRKVKLSKTIYSYRSNRNDNRAIKSVANNKTSLLKCLLPQVRSSYQNVMYTTFGNNISTS